MRRTRWGVSAAMAAAMVTSMLTAAPAQAYAPKPSPAPLTGQSEPLDDHGYEVAGQAHSQNLPEQVERSEPVWPGGSATAELTSAARARATGKPAAVQVGSLPVWVDQPVSADRAAPTQVSVDILDRKATPEPWRDAVLLRVVATDGASSRAAADEAPLKVSVDYSKFRYAYGGDWAARLRLWRVPSCALEDQAPAGCQVEPLPSVNDAALSLVSAQLDIPTAEAARSAAGTTMIALMAGPTGSGGDFTATTLQASSTWSAGGSTGDFSWTYPVRLPPGITGPMPGVGLSYSSSSVDGRSEATNNQPSWIGEGFEYTPGFIERRYVPCSEDMGGTANNSVKTGDLCWRSDNATMSLNGRSTELIFETGKGWHGRTEDGSHIEKLTGATNGDNNGEHWKVTDADGVQYFFGLNRPDGHSSDTNSTWTTRVYGNHTGEPCRQSSFAASHCMQAWRWNLDYVIDPHGNTNSYWYDKELNKYAANLTSSDTVSYDRGGVLRRIEYGTWDRGAGDRSTTPIAQVLFDVADRCLSNCGTHDATRWPDVPWDQECAQSATTCGTNYSPTFWSTKRLAKVTTRVWNTSATPAEWQDVDSWTLTHSFPSPGDGTNAGLWLASVQHTGHVGGTVTLPPVTFEPVSMPNRVLTPTNTTNNWHRMSSIVTESGSKVQVTYSLPECTPSNLPSAAHTNTKLCYPVIGPDPADPDELITEWWHKYVVRQVSEVDIQLTGGHQSPQKNTFYDYEGSPAWHYADDDGLTKPNRKTWSQFRGYATVKARTGDTAGAQTLTETRYLRGMHGDRAAPAGGTRDITVPASLGTETVKDEDQFAGQIREQIVYNGDDTKPVSKSVNVPWMSPATASRTINGDTATARYVDTRVTYSATALGDHGSRGWRVTRQESSFDPTYGSPIWTQDDGDTAVSGDEKCVTYTYNRNLTKNILGATKLVTTKALPCATNPTSPNHIIDEVRTSYDGAASPDTAPTAGVVTKVEKLKAWSAGSGTTFQTVSQTVVDGYGRPTAVTDARGNTVTTVYTPSSGGPVTKTTRTEPAPYNWVTQTEVSPYWGSTTKITDPNSRVTTVEYDPIGRVANVWEVGWAKASNPTKPSSKFTYVFSPTRSDYPYVKTETLNARANYVPSYQIFDGLLRTRQTQTISAKNNGRVVTDTIWDSSGRASTSYPEHLELGDPSGTLWWEPEWSLRAVNKTIFDDANRPVAEVFLAGDDVSNLVEKWRTTTAYEGDLTKTTPPDGAVATTTVTDADGRTVETRRHNTAAGVGGTHDLTRYEYNAKDQLVKIVGPTGNEWRTTYDIQGRVIETSDPDKGTSQSEYNDLGDLVETTDARGEVLAYTYDQLGRKTAIYDDVVSPATKRAEWKYDRLINMAPLRGQLTESIRYEPAGSTNAYKWQLLGATQRYQPTGARYVIPTTETGLGGDYDYLHGYAPADGSPLSTNFPAAGTLIAEELTTVYDPVSGLPIALTSTATGTYVSEQKYTEFGEPTEAKRRMTSGLYVDDVVTYDPATRRVTGTAIQPENASGKVVNRSYEYTDAGTFRQIADAPDVGQADTQCFRRDALTRLTTAWTPKTGVTCAANPTVADLGGPAPYWNSWTYDATGNRLTQVQHTATGNNTQTSAYPTQGASAVRPHAVTSVTRSGPAGAGVDAYNYDATGNTTSRPGVSSAQTLTWNSEGRLASVTDAGATTSNVYDADGGRLIRRDAAGTTLYLPGMELRREAGTTTCTRYITFAGQTIAQRTSNNLADLTWLYADHQGTGQTAITAITQTVTTRRTTPYGTPRGTNPTWPNSKGFVGGDIDPTGLTHLGARAYDPGQGRFISVDPVFVTEDPRQHHGYQYGANDPVTHSDPTGLKLPSDSKSNDGPPASTPEKKKNPGPAKCNWLCQQGKKISGAVDTGANWVKENKAEITGFVVGTVVGVGCGAAIGWTGAGLVACGALAGAAGSYVTGYMNGERGLDLVTTTIIGGLTGAVTSVLGPVAGKALGAGVRAAAGVITGGGARAAAGAAGTAASAGAKNVAATAGKATGIKLPTLKTAGKSCPTHSFAAGTAVVMADGTTKPIADIEVGNKVLATDPETGETSPRTVTVEHLNLDNELTDLTITDATGETHLIETTPNHPFWSTTRHAWIGAANLQPGETLHTLDDTTATIAQVKTYTDPTYMYDLTVADIHTYYVVAGNTPVLVHNCGPRFAAGADGIEDLANPLPARGGYVKVPELDGGPMNKVGNPIWGNSNPVALIGARTPQQLRGLASLGDARKLQDFYQGAVNAGAGGKTAPNRVTLLQEIIDAWGG